MWYGAVILSLTEDHFGDKIHRTAIYFSSFFSAGLVEVKFLFINQVNNKLFDD